MMVVQQTLIPKHCHIKLNNALATMQRPTDCPFSCPFSRIHRDPVRVSIDLQFQLHSVSAHISLKSPHSEHLQVCLLLELLDFHQWLFSVPPRVFLCNYGSVCSTSLKWCVHRAQRPGSEEWHWLWEEQEMLCMWERHFVCETSDFPFAAAVCPPPLIFKQSQES